MNDRCEHRAAAPAVRGSLSIDAARTVTDARQVQLAYGRTRKNLSGAPTPLIQCPTTLPGFTVWYKYEHAFPTGSFKERGALNALLLLTPEEKARGVIAASAANRAGVPRKNPRH